jgi:hypothetical protein
LSWVSDDAQWMLDKFKMLDDSAFPQQFAPIAGKFLMLSVWFQTSQRGFFIFVS